MVLVLGTKEARNTHKLVCRELDEVSSKMELEWVKPAGEATARSSPAKWDSGLSDQPIGVGQPECSTA